MKTKPTRTKNGMVSPDNNTATHFHQGDASDWKTCSAGARNQTAGINTETRSNREETWGRWGGPNAGRLEQGQSVVSMISIVLKTFLLQSSQIF